MSVKKPLGIGVWPEVGGGCEESVGRGMLSGAAEGSNTEMLMVDRV